MALQEKLAAQSQRFLPDGAAIRQVFVCQTGPNPWFAMFTGFMFMRIKYRIVCVTREGIYVLRSDGKLQARPAGVLQLLPRLTELGPVRGIWSQLDLMGERHWVHRRFHDQVRVADKEARFVVNWV